MTISSSIQATIAEALFLGHPPAAIAVALFTWMAYCRELCPDSAHLSSIASITSSHAGHNVPVIVATRGVEEGVAYALSEVPQ